MSHPYPVQNDIAQVELSHDVQEKALHADLRGTGLPCLDEAVQCLEWGSEERVAVLKLQGDSSRKS